MPQTDTKPQTVTRTGLQRTSDGWIVASVTREAESDRIVRQKLLAGPFTGPGSKLRAIKQNGGDNTVLV